LRRPARRALDETAPPALRGGRGPRRRADPGVSAAPSVLLVGLGRWGEKHLRVLRDLGTDLWVADVTESRRAWAARQGVSADRIVADYRQALAHVGAVDVVT